MVVVVVAMREHNCIADTTTDELYWALKTYSYKYPKFDVYLKSQMPKEFAYKNNRRIGDVIVMDKLGYRSIFLAADVPNGKFNMEICNALML